MLMVGMKMFCCCDARWTLPANELAASDAVTRRAYASSSEIVILSTAGGELEPVTLCWAYVPCVYDELGARVCRRR